MEGVKVNRSLTIPPDELEMVFLPSGGPGGQHANRSSTKVVLSWDVGASRVLGPRQRQRIEAALRSRIDASGVLRLSSDRHRSQWRNREDVTRRLGEIVARALRPVAPRTATKPTRSSRDKRIKVKKQRGEIKKGRRRPRRDDD